MFHRMVAMFHLLVLCLVLSGCYAEEELGDVTVVTGILLDYSFSEQAYSLVAETADFNDYEKSSALKTKFLKANGKTLSEAFADLNINSGKELYFSHAKVIVLGKAFRDLHLKNAVDFFINHTEINSDILLCMAGYDGLLPEQAEEKPFCPNLYDFFKKDKYTLESKLYELYQQENQTFCLPEISLTQDNLSISDTAIFHNYTYNTTLTENENLIFKLLKTNLSNENFPLETADFLILKGKTKLSVENEQLTADISLSMKLTDSRQIKNSESVTEKPEVFKQQMEAKITTLANQLIERLISENKAELLTEEPFTLPVRYNFRIKISQAGILNEF